MDPSDIIKAAPGIAKVAAPLAAAIPFTAIVKRMLGPAADEVAEMWRDQVRAYRYERQVKLLEKVEKIAREAGFEPQAVPPKILFPLLEGASFEDDESLHDMWAALLANAASPETANKVRPGFIAILKQMAPDEALLLKRLHGDFRNQDDEQGRWKPVMALFRRELLLTVFQSLGLSETGGYFCLERLQAQYLISISQRGDDPDIATVTISAVRFIESCRPPKPKS